MIFIKSLSALTFLFALTMLFSCGNAGEKSHDGHAHPHGEGKEYTSAYVCPMHCDDSGSDQMGQCHVCGMDYVAQDEHVNDGHTH